MVSAPSILSNERAASGCGISFFSRMLRIRSACQNQHLDRKFARDQILTQTRVSRIILHHEIELRQMDYHDALKRIIGSPLDFAANQN